MNSADLNPPRGQSSVEPQNANLPRLVVTITRLSCILVAGAGLLLRAADLQNADSQLRKSTGAVQRHRLGYRDGARPRRFRGRKCIDGKSDDEVRREIGFPKLIYHSIVCMGALVSRRQDDFWAVAEIGAPNVGERSEKEIMRSSSATCCRP